jgi:hypothetical protein
MSFITNTKTGNIGTKVCEYKHLSNGKTLVEVITLAGHKAHWLKSHTVEGA